MVLNTKIKDDFHKFDYPKIEKEFSNLLQLKDLDQQIADQPSLINSFEKDFEVILAGSFEAEFDFSGSFLFLQRILYRINRLKLFWYDDLGNYSTLFGPDPWPYNLKDNRTALEAVVRYEHEQGMIQKRPKIEELFFPPSLQEIQHYI